MLRAMWLSWTVLVAASAAMVFGAPEWLRAVLTVGAVFWVPGRAWAATRWTDPTERALNGAWIGLGIGAASFLLAKATGLGGGGVMAFAAITTAAAGRGRAGPRWEMFPFIGLVFAIVLVGAWGVHHRADVTRPLDASWWFGPAEELPEHGRPPEIATGQTKKRQGPWKQAGALRLDPKGAHASIVGPTDGPIVLALRGPIGATLWAGDQKVVVTADVTVNAEEGPVPRYQDRGVAAIELPKKLTAGEPVELLFSAPDQSLLYIVPSQEAIWALHDAGELRFSHYYQLLNMVEQLRWAEDRWVTDVQPPLWSWLLGAALAVTEGGLPTANVLCLYVLLVGALAGLRFLGVFAPNAPVLAWLLPGLAAIGQARMMVEPGSAGMPDTIYAAAILTGIGGAVEAGGLLAQLLRYPGALVVAVGALFRGEPRRAATMLGMVLLTAAAFGVGGLATGSLDGWLATVAWETGPEHWHGNFAPAELAARIPRFYGWWLVYAGGAPLLAAVRWPVGTRVALGTAIVYSGLLATIDHSPSHYFLPLVSMAIVAVGTTSERFRAPWLRWLLPALCMLGLSTWQLVGTISD